MLVNLTLFSRTLHIEYDWILNYEFVIYDLKDERARAALFCFNLLKLSYSSGCGLIEKVWLQMKIVGFQTLRNHYPFASPSPLSIISKRYCNALRLLHFIVLRLTFIVPLVRDHNKSANHYCRRILIVYVIDSNCSNHNQAQSRCPRVYWTELERHLDMFWM